MNFGDKRFTPNHGLRAGLCRTEQSACLSDEKEREKHGTTHGTNLHRYIQS
jgi:hypothetical protein